MARLQIIGPVVLFGTLLAADSAAYVLAMRPSSGLVWHLNLEIFSLFRKSRAVLGEYGGLPFALAILAGPILALALAGLAFKRNLLVAASSNLSLCYAGFLLYCWQFWHATASVKAASLLPVHVQSAGEVSWFAVLMVATLVSTGASHVFYVRAMRAGR